MTTDRIAELERRIEDSIDTLVVLRNDLNALKHAQPAKEWPEPGNNIFALYVGGMIHSQVWKDGSDDRYMLTCGLIHRTEADANAAHARRVLDAKLRRLGGGEWSKGKDNWTIILNHRENGCADTAYYSNLQLPNCVFWPTKEAAEAALDACRSELEALR